MGVKAEGLDRVDQKLERDIQTLSDERLIVGIVLEAVQPAVDAAKAIVGTGSPYRETGLTREDIHATVNKESAVGVVKVSIGASKRNAYKLRFLERGTSKQRAYPVLRPAHDSTRSQVMASIAAGLMKSGLGRR